MKDELERIAERLVSGGIEKILTETDRLRAEAIGLLEEHERKKIWSGYDHLPSGAAPERIVPGCLVLEGGSFRGLYTSGVLDVLMENGINLQTVIGTSAGALNGYNYVAGEIGRAARINLGYRHDSRYLGARAMAKSRGVVGLQFIIQDIESEVAFNRDRFDREDRRFLVTVTNCETGETMYCEKGKTADFDRAVQASATMPMISETVEVEGIPCLDGGCSTKIPYRWAIENGFDKILVVRTRPIWFRRTPEGKRVREITELMYRNYPQLTNKMAAQTEEYNASCDELEELQRQGRVMMLCPSGSIQTATLEGDMERLGALYLLGRRDTEVMLPDIRNYLGLE